MYAQIISPEDNTIVASASTLQAEVKKSLKNGKTGNIEAAEIVGKVIAQKAKKARELKHKLQQEHLDKRAYQIALSHKINSTK